MSLAGRLSARVPPDAAITNAAHRAFLALHAARGPRSGDRPSRALARALRTAALGRFPPAGRAWIDRIEARRSQLGREHAVADGSARLVSPARSREAWSPPPAWSIPRVWGRFLLQLVFELAPRSCVELGTGFGISALYQGAALELRDAGRLITLDQEESLIPHAREGFARLGLDRRIELTSGPIGRTLPGWPSAKPRSTTRSSTPSTPRRRRSRTSTRCAPTSPTTRWSLSTTSTAPRI